MIKDDKDSGDLRGWMGGNFAAQVERLSAHWAGRRGKSWFLGQSWYAVKKIVRFGWGVWNIDGVCGDRDER